MDYPLANTSFLCRMEAVIKKYYLMHVSVNCRAKVMQSWWVMAVVWALDFTPEWIRGQLMHHWFFVQHENLIKGLNEIILSVVDKVF